MRNIMNGFMRRHLSVEVWEGHTKIRTTPIDDPFIHTTIESETRFSWWDRLRILFRGKHESRFRVHVVAGSVAVKRWFAGQDGCDRCGATIGYPHDGSSAADPGFHHGDERLCESCYYGTEQPKPTAQCCDQQRA